MTFKNISFNPRTRTGCDDIPVEFTGPIQVSIHAPARGATVYRVSIALLDLFQSTHPHGVRQAWYRHLKKYQEFQSTHPHGVRLLSGTFSTYCDGVSIHVPARGATEPVIQGNYRSYVSIHAPARGATASF